MRARFNGKVIRPETNNSMPVTIQDQTSGVTIVNSRRLDVSTTLTQAAAVGDSSIVVADATGVSAGHSIDMSSMVTNRYMISEVVSVVDNTITIDAPIISNFPTGSNVQTGIKDLSVNGASTTQVFSIRGADPVNIEFDVTQIAINLITSGATLYTSFGDIADGLTNGVEIRKKRNDGEYDQVMNIKSNNDMDLYFGSFMVYNPANPSGIYGATARINFGGQDNFGSVIRLAPGEDLEVLIQDDLSSITKIEVIIKGSPVLP